MTSFNARLALFNFEPLSENADSFGVQSNALLMFFAIERDCLKECLAGISDAFLKMCIRYFKSFGGFSAEASRLFKNVKAISINNATSMHYSVEV